MMRARQMYKKTRKALLYTVLVSAVVWTGCRGQLSEKPPIHPNPNMDQQKRLDPQEPSAFFKDKRAMRGLIKGTVARPLIITRKDRDSRFLKADDHLYRGYKEVTKKETFGSKVSITREKVFYAKLPKNVKLTLPLLKRGKERYDIYCAVCHSYSGNGQGVVTLYEKGFMPRNLHSARVRGMKVGEIYNVIVNGAGKMNALRSAIPVSDRWAIVAYVRALQLSRLISTSSKSSK